MKLTTAVAITTVLGCAAVMAAPQRVKRQSLFSCSGWGASCTSGWRTVTSQSQQKFKPPQRIMPPSTDGLTRYWLTTEKAWGPMGKRSSWWHTDIPYLMSLTDLLKLRQNIDREGTVLKRRGTLEPQEY